MTSAEKERKKGLCKDLERIKKKIIIFKKIIYTFIIYKLMTLRD